MKIVIIGAGNVGFHLGKALSILSGISVLQVYSRTKTKAQNSAKNIGCSYTTKIHNITEDADLYIFAVSDSAIGSIAEELSQLSGFQQKLVVHTSGATSSSIFSPHFSHFGIFYPLQTFSISKQPDFINIPFCVYAKRESDIVLLENLAKKLSQKVERIDDKKRAILHVAAVFVNNFSNYLFTIGEEILEKEDISFDLLKPLIAETVDKIKDNKASDMQTGPAIRKDDKTIKKHLEYLEQLKDFQEIYYLMSKNIAKRQ